MRIAMSVLLLGAIFLTEASAAPLSLEKQLPISMKLRRVPGAQVYIFRNDGFEKSLAVGLRDFRSQDKVTEKTLFQAAGLVRPLTALLTLQTAARGGFSLRDPLDQLPHSLKLDPKKKNSYKSAPTLADLLSMTSGLAASWDGVYHDREAKMPSLEEFLQKEFQIASNPGESIAHSTVGYGYTQWFLEKQSGKSYGELLRSEVLAPLGMRATRSDLPADFKGDFAQGHLPLGKKKRFFPIPRPRVLLPAAMSLYTTARDYGRFLRTVSVGTPTGSSPRDVLLRPAISYGPELGETGFGFELLRLDGLTPTPAYGRGLEKNSYKQEGPKRYLYRVTGRQAGYSALAVFVPGKGGAVILANRENPHFLREMMSIIYREYLNSFIPAGMSIAVRQPVQYPIKRKGVPNYDVAKLEGFEELTGFYRPRNILPGHAGWFRFFTDSRIAITNKRGLELSGIFEREAAIQLMPLGKDVFLARGNAGMNGWRLRVLREDDGDIKGLVTDGVRYDRLPYILSVWSIIIGLGLLIILPFAIAFVVAIRKKRTD